MQQAFIALGSNLEPRNGYLEKARALLQNIPHQNWMESTIRETNPIGPAGQGKYLNQVVSFRTDLTALQLLHYCKGAELWLGRKPRGHWEEREIDLDLLYLGDQILQKERLILPHPRIAERGFVLEPLNDLNPHWLDPVHHKTMAQLWQEWQAKEST